VATSPAARRADAAVINRVGLLRDLIDRAVTSVAPFDHSYERSIEVCVSKRVVARRRRKFLTIR
jgi:hypothetical protein